MGLRTAIAGTLRSQCTLSRKSSLSEKSERDFPTSEREKYFGVASGSRYQPSSCVLGPLSQNLSWCRSPCRSLELQNWCSLSPVEKINGAYYRNVLLAQHLLPAIRSVAGNFFTYNAPAHRAGDTVEFLSRNTPDFINTFAVAAQ